MHDFALILVVLVVLKKKEAWAEEKVGPSS